MSNPGLKDKAVRALNNRHVSKINFRVNGVVIKGSDFIQIKNKIGNGTIEVLGMSENNIDVPESLSGVYRFDNDKLYLKDNVSADIIIHECAHAIVDSQRLSRDVTTRVTTLENECIGYLAQSMYLLFNSLIFIERLRRDDTTRANNVFKKAKKVLQDNHAVEQMPSRLYDSLSTQTSPINLITSLGELKLAIQAHPTYRGCCDSQYVNSDGISEQTTWFSALTDLF